MPSSNQSGYNADQVAELIAGLNRVRDLLRTAHVRGKYGKQVADAYTASWEALAKAEAIGRKSR